VEKLSNIERDIDDLHARTNNCAKFTCHQWDKCPKLGLDVSGCRILSIPQSAQSVAVSSVYSQSVFQDLEVFEEKYEETEFFYADWPLVWHGVAHGSCGTYWTKVCLEKHDPKVLSEGAHSIAIYVADWLGNSEYSTVFFTVALPVSSPSPTLTPSSSPSPTASSGSSPTPSLSPSPSVPEVPSSLILPLTVSVVALVSTAIALRSKRVLRNLKFASLRIHSLIHRRSPRQPTETYEKLAPRCTRFYTR
jgi:hypothetical protein